MPKYDEDAFVREMQHKHLMSEQRYKQLDKQIEDAMRSEYAAMNQMAKSSPEAKQELIHEQNRLYINEQLRIKSDKDAANWRTIWITTNIFGLMLIIYTLFQFM